MPTLCSSVEWPCPLDLKARTTLWSNHSTKSHHRHQHFLLWIPLDHFFFVCLSISFSPTLLTPNHLALSIISAAQSSALGSPQGPKMLSVSLIRLTTISKSTGYYLHTSMMYTQSYRSLKSTSWNWSPLLFFRGYSPWTIQGRVVTILPFPSVLMRSLEVQNQCACSWNLLSPFPEQNDIHII